MRDFGRSWRLKVAVSWKPFHQGHAIERVRISIQFQGPVPKPMEVIVGKIFDEQAERLGFLPKKDTSAYQVVLDQTMAASASPKVVPNVGWQASRVLHNGNVVEVVGMEPMALTHEIAEYTRWANNLDRYTAVCGDLISKLREGVIPAALTLEYFDRFIFDGPSDQATVKGLLVPQFSALLPDNAAKGSELWHIHRGWFQKLRGSRLLVNQNIEVQDGVSQIGTPVRTLSLYSKVEKAAHSNLIDFSEFVADLGQLHDLSRAVLEKTLVPAAKKAIGLN